MNLEEIESLELEPEEDNTKLNLVEIVYSMKILMDNKEYLENQLSNINKQLIQLEGSINEVIANNGIKLPITVSIDDNTDVKLSKKQYTDVKGGLMNIDNNNNIATDIINEDRLNVENGFESILDKSSFIECKQGDVKYYVTNKTTLTKALSKFTELRKRLVIEDKISYYEKISLTVVGKKSEDFV